MQKFKVFAEFIDPSKRKYNPEWESEVSAYLIGEALAQGKDLFHAHCVANQLDFSLFEVHAGTP